MTDLPHEIQVWRSTDTLDHIGTWATTRFPPEAVTYVPKADAQAAVALAVERAATALKPFADRVFYDNGDCTVSDTHSLKTADFIQANRTIRALAPADALAAVEALRAERDAWRKGSEAQAAENVRLAADLAASRAREAGLVETLRQEIEALEADLTTYMDTATEYMRGEEAAIAERDRLAANLDVSKAREEGLVEALTYIGQYAGTSVLTGNGAAQMARAALASTPLGTTLTTTQAAGQTDGHECLHRSHDSRADGVPADAVGNGNCLPLEGGPEAPEAQDELTRLRELIRKAYHALNPDRPTGPLANRLLERTRYLLKAEVRVHFPGEVDRG